VIPQPEHRLERHSAADGTSFTTHRWPRLTHEQALIRAQSVAPAFQSDDQSVHLVTWPAVKVTRLPPGTAHGLKPETFAGAFAFAKLFIHS
jgi:hypothetical protein